MRRSHFAALTVPAVALAALLSAAPAQAATEPLFDTTVEVLVLPSGDSLLGETAYVPSTGGGLIVSLGAVQPGNVLFELLEGATTLASCTIATGDGVCSPSVPALSGGAHAVTARFTQGATVVEYPGTLFSVVSASPSVAIQWQDASGAWVDGSGIGLPLFGDTAMRCVVTNNSNAPFTFSSFTGSVSYAGAPPATTITGTLAGGATGYYPIWSGSSSPGPSGSCSGGVTLADGTGTGNGIGGGTIPIGGTITASPALALGRTITITGDELVPPVISSLEVTFDGEPVDGSPVTISGPDYDFSIDVTIPASLAPGTHTIEVGGSFSGRDVVFAAFSLVIPAPAALPATGVDAATPVMVSLGVLAAGAVLLLLASRRRRA